MRNAPGGARSASAPTPQVVGFRARGFLATILALGAPACGDPAGARASLSVAETLADADTAGYARAVEARPFRFPEDHGPHPAFKHEWWYFTGNLEGDDGRELGFQLTFFRSALRPDSVAVDSRWATRQAFMGHFALTDAGAGTFHAFERFQRGALGLAGARGAPMRVWIGDWEAASTTDPAPIQSGVPPFRIRAAEDGVALDLVLSPTQPVVLQGDRGLSAKGPEPGNASYYYSLVRLAARGTVTVAGAARRVTGEAWLDREWSTSALSPGLAGWDWFSLQLDDGSELMLYRLRREDGGTSPFSAGTFVDPGGDVLPLGSDDFALEATGRWTSPRGGDYPSGWRLRVPDLALDIAVTPRLQDQELDLAFRYWEGAVRAEGRRGGRPVAGKGYVELTGYADEPGP